jgi:cytochrome c oxidase subunit 4
MTTQHTPVTSGHKTAVHESPHPGPWQYVQVAVILALVTAVEVAIYYIRSIQDYLAPILIVLSLVKFSLVVLWFMHLKFDSPVLRRLFLVGLILALTVYGIVLFTFGILVKS